MFNFIAWVNGMRLRAPVAGDTCSQVRDALAALYGVPACKVLVELA